MKNMHAGLLTILMLLLPVFAHADIIINIDQPEDRRFPIAIANIHAGPSYQGSAGNLKKISQIIRDDLNMSGYFFVIKPSLYNDRTKAMDAASIPWSTWRGIGARAVVKGLADTKGGKTSVQLHLFDTATKELQTGKRYTFDLSDWRLVGHRFADELMLAMTGIRGPFATKIAYTVMTKRSKKKRWKQIYVADMDGNAPLRITKDNTYNLGPSWAPDGRHLAIASYISGFPDIYILDLKTGRRRQLTANKSTNITPEFSPDGSTIAYSSGQGRDMEIFLMSNVGTNERLFAPAFGIDLAPVFSPDGTQILFASERGGKLNIYRMPINGSGSATRITFGGQNDSPDWSPDGTRITFTRYMGGKYDVFTVNPDGSAVRRITYVGSNEHPRWAPDSRYITFSKKVGRKSQIYLMRFDGAAKHKITKGKDSTLPDWGPWPADYWDDY